ncbi:MAG: glycosyltransferase family 2 protein [Solirubrobacteraceae bacterium]
MSFGCVVLTTGGKPDDLRLAVGSLLRQRDVEADVVVVGNGWAPASLPAGVRGVHVAVDEGIPAGRNAAVPHARGEVLFFLDDDAALADDDALARVAAMFAAEPALGMVQLRVDPRAGGAPLRDWTPRLRVGDRTRSSELTVVWEGAVAVRRTALEAAGGWPASLRFVHEGVALGWRVMDAGYVIRYAGDIAALHPVTGAPPHDYAFYYGARNRVWLARRHLPVPLGVLYVAGFALRLLPRYRRRPTAVREALRGYRDGLRTPSGERHRLKASTLWRMTRAGRPPIL